MAAATAGAVGLGTLSASITIGSATLIAGGVPLVASVFGAAGASLFSYKVHLLTKGVGEFAFLQVPFEEAVPTSEEQNILERIDYQVDAAVERLASVLSHPQVVFDIYRESQEPEDPKQPSPRKLNEEVIIEMITDFELIQDSLGGSLTPIPMPAADSIPSSEIEEDKKKAQEIVDQLEASLVDLRRELERTTVVIPQVISEETDRCVSILRNPDYPPRVQVCVCVSGWIWSEADFSSTWAPLYGQHSSTELFSLRWESSELQELGRHFLSAAAAGVVTKVAQNYAMRTVFASTLSALALPMTALQLSGLIGHPWNVVFNRARKCGKLLAHTLINKVLGYRPVTLVGFSHGARLLFHCLEELARCKAMHLIENAYLMGAPVTNDGERWKNIRQVVSGRLVNAFSPSDWILALHQTARAEYGLAGLQPVR